MATRNLTEKFAQLRAERGRSSSSSNLAGASGGGASLLSDTPNSSEWSTVKNMLPPVWVDSVEEVEADIAKIEEKIETLTGLHKKRLMAFDESSERDLDREVDVLTQSITALFRRSERVLKRIASDAVATPNEEKIRQNVARTLASKLQQTSINFRKQQKNYLTKRKSQKEGATGGFDFLSEAEQGGAAAQPQLMAIDGGTAFTMEQLAVVDDMDKLAAERDEEIRKIVESIEELSAIFKELAVLVIDQGTILDRIDYQMEQVVEQVEDGVTHLERAEEYQKSARPRYCICFLLVTITILLTFLILKHTGKLGRQDDDDGGEDDIAATVSSST